MTEVTALYLTILFAALGEEFAYFFHDDRDILTRAAGIGRFGRSKGGHLLDDVHDGRVGTIDEIETYLLELCGFEQGLMLQNIALATEAVGLGGFPHYGAHRFAWTKAFGFTMRERTFAQVLHKGVFGTLLMRILNKNVSIPQAVGLDHEGRTIIKPFAPPHYPTMEAAVRAFVDYKFAPGTGFFRDATKPTAWRDPATIQASIPPYSEANIQAVIGYCEYVMKHYGQFPGNFGPIRTLMAFQAHHLDTAFYDRFFRPGAYTEAHAGHFARWHPAHGVVTPAPHAYPERPDWVPRDLYPVRGPLGRDRGQPRPLRRRGQRDAAPAAERQPELVVRMARRDPRPARLVPLHRAGLPGVRDVAGRRRL